MNSFLIVVCPACKRMFNVNYAGGVPDRIYYADCPHCKAKVDAWAHAKQRLTEDE